MRLWGRTFFSPHLFKHLLVPFKVKVKIELSQGNKSFPCDSSMKKRFFVAF